MIEKIYLDLDGVFADFWGKVCEIFGKEPENNKMMWDKLKKVPHLFLNLKPLPNSIIMFNKIYSNYGNKCEILTSVPRPENFLITAVDDKKEWVKTYLSDKIIVNTVSNHSEKKNFCFGKEYVLIDDYDKNVNDWISKGGTAILHKNWGKTYLNLIKENIL